MSTIERGAPLKRRLLATTLSLGMVLGAQVVLDGAATALPGAELAEAGAKKPTTPTASTTTSPTTTGTFREERLTDPARVVVHDERGPVATFTVGSRSVLLRGPQRTFVESTTTATVTTTAWVRLLAQPFPGTVDWNWLSARLSDSSDDVLALATQYVTGAPARTDASGLRFAGDASYGPLLADGTREEGSDFNDYLGVPWTYGTQVDEPEVPQHGAMDCSGYVRTVFGYRAGLPMTLQSDGIGLPRRAVQMNASAPGVMVIPNTGTRPTSSATLQAGDLVFFDASADDGTLVDHVGIHLGLDSAGAPRFLSSRKSADGPTMGDIRGRSTLSGTGLYATSFRSARRL
ncbi:NlpC/P60 family protein [Modestobacter sp. URMC 112]